jgi:hypothetical protein
MAKSAIATANQSATDNATTTAPVVIITPMSYFTKNAPSVMMSQLDGAESRTVFGQTIVVFPNEGFDYTNEQLEDKLQEKAKAILFGDISLASTGETLSVVAASKWFCETLKRGYELERKYAPEIHKAGTNPAEVMKVVQRYAEFVNFNDLNDSDTARLSLVSKADYAKAEEIQAFFKDNCLNLSRGEYLVRGTGSIWSIHEKGIVLGVVA